MWFLTKKNISFTKNKEGQIEVPCTTNTNASSFVYDADVEDSINFWKRSFVFIKNRKS